MPPWGANMGGVSRARQGLLPAGQPGVWVFLELQPVFPHCYQPRAHSQTFTVMLGPPESSRSAVTGCAHEARQDIYPGSPHA
jgi:hypothetical protein